jgi:hypothetical protein
MHEPKSSLPQPDVQISSQDTAFVAKGMEFEIVRSVSLMRPPDFENNREYVSKL